MTKLSSLLLTAKIQIMLLVLGTNNFGVAEKHDLPASYTQTGKIGLFKSQKLVGFKSI